MLVLAQGRTHPPLNLLTHSLTLCASRARQQMGRWCATRRRRRVQHMAPQLEAAHKKQEEHALSCCRVTGRPPRHSRVQSQETWIKHRPATNRPVVDEGGARHEDGCVAGPEGAALHPPQAQSIHGVTWSASQPAGYRNCTAAAAAACPGMQVTKTTGLSRTDCSGRDAGRQTGRRVGWAESHDQPAAADNHKGMHAVASS